MERRLSQRFSLGMESKSPQSFFSSGEEALPTLPALKRGKPLMPTAWGRASRRITDVTSLGSGCSPITVIQARTIPGPAVLASGMASPPMPLNTHTRDSQKTLLFTYMRPCPFFAHNLSKPISTISYTEEEDPRSQRKRSL